MSSVTTSASTPSGGGIRIVTQRRLIEDLNILPEEWNILVLDPRTSKILQSSLKQLPPTMQVIEEFLPKRRAPFDFEAVYYIEPTAANVKRILEDFGPEEHNILYKKAHILFSSRVLQPDELRRIMGSERKLLARLGTLQEFNLDYCIVDNRVVTISYPDAFSKAFTQQIREAEVQQMVAKLATVFATLTCYPNIRYQAGSCAKLCQDVARGMDQVLSQWQHQGLKPPLPTQENGDLLILDRSFDITAPFLHPWTYEAMVYEYVHLQDDRVVIPEGGPAIPPEHLELNEDDKRWVGMRYLHYRDAAAWMDKNSEEYHQRFGQLRPGATNDPTVKQDVAAVFEKQNEGPKLALHLRVIFGELTPRFNGVAPYEGLRTLREWEMAMLSGSVKEKDLLDKEKEFALINRADPADRQRLLVCWLAAFPQQMTPPARMQWQRRLGLTGDQVDVACNIAKMGTTLPHTGLRYNVSAHNAPELLLERVIRDHVAEALPSDRFPYLKGPPALAAPQASGGTGSRFQLKRAGKPKTAAPRRLVVFVIGGVSRAELGVAHKLSEELKRDIIIASTSVGTAKEFLEQLQMLGRN